MEISFELPGLGGFRTKMVLREGWAGLVAGTADLLPASVPLVGGPSDNLGCVKFLKKGGSWFLGENFI